MEDKELLGKLRTDYDFVKRWKEEQIATEGADIVATRYKEDYFNKLVAYRKWYEGDHWTVRPDGTLMDTTNDVIKPTINLVKIIIDQQYSLLKRRKITADIRPVEESDVSNAKALEDIIKYAWKKYEVQSKISDAFKDSLIYGVGFLKVRWDGKNISIDIINPLNIYPDKFGETIDDMRYIVIVYERTPEYIRFVYDKEEQADEKGRVIVYESWYNPSIDYPDGLYVAWTDKQILKKKTLHEVVPTGTIPIIAFIHNKMSNTFWGISEVKNLAEVQLVHNKTFGFILDNLALTNNNQFLTTDETIAKNGISNRPGAIIPVETLDSITPMPHTSISPQWFQVLSYTGYPLMQQITGTYAVNLGGAARTETASGIIALQQAGGVLTESNFLDIAVECKKLVKIIFGYLFKFKRSSLLDMTDENVDFTNLNLDRDIFIDFSDAYPDDKIARINMFTQMMMIPPDKFKILAKLIGDPYLEELAEQSENQQAAMQQAAMQQVATQGGQNG